MSNAVILAVLLALPRNACAQTSRQPNSTHRHFIGRQRRIGAHPRTLSDAQSTSLHRNSRHQVRDGGDRSIAPFRKHSASCHYSTAATPDFSLRAITRTHLRASRLSHTSFCFCYSRRRSDTKMKATVRDQRISIHMYLDEP